MHGQGETALTVQVGIAARAGCHPQALKGRTVQCAADGPMRYVPWSLGLFHAIPKGNPKDFFFFLKKKTETAAVRQLPSTY